jgi:hypothetical protein
LFKPGKKLGPVETVLDIIMEKRNFKVLALGQCCLDYIGKIVSCPPPDTKCEFSDMVMQGRMIRRPAREKAPHKL